MADNYNVNIVQIGSKLVTISDMTGMKVLDPDSLETLGEMTWNDKLSKEKIAMITCAHPAKLPFDKYIYNYIVNMVPANVTHMYNTQFFRIDTTKASTNPTYIHKPNLHPSDAHITRDA